MTTDEETRLKDQRAFHCSAKISEARERVCEAAIEWWRATDGPDYWKALGKLRETAKRLAELEEQ